MTGARRSAGLALISAIFLVVVLVAFALTAVSLTSVSHDTGAKALASARVYYGAKAGLDWAIHQAIAPAAPVCSAATSFTLAQGALNGVNVTVNCSATTHGAGSFVYYIRVTATAGTLGNVNYAERHVEATVSNIP